VIGVCLADQGHQVICVDNDKTKLELLQKGQAPIYEPGLDELLLKNFVTKRLVFTEDLQEAVEKSEVIFCVYLHPRYLTELPICDISGKWLSK
jgi:Predicted UDP-glucose 6-dehydrogenase